MWNDDDGTMFMMRMMPLIHGFCFSLENQHPNVFVFPGRHVTNEWEWTKVGVKCKT